MTAAALCPHCGYDLVRDEPVTLGDLFFDPRGEVTWKDVKLAHLPPSQREILWAIVKARGRTITKAVLLDRCDSSGDMRTVDTLICRLRDAFRAIDPDFDRIETVWREGLRWRL